jgi:tRNA(fMet)-specific endonuclease VapC
MLDTNTVSYYLRGEPAIVRRMQAQAPSDLCLSAITAMELRYGVQRKKSRVLTTAVEAIMADLIVVPFDQAAAAEAGRICALVESKGVTLGLADAQIAGHASTLGLILISSDTAFRRISGLTVKDWRKD